MRSSAYFWAEVMLPARQIGHARQIFKSLLYMRVFAANKHRNIYMA